MAPLNYLPPPDIHFSPSLKTTPDTHINIYNTNPSLSLNFMTFNSPNTGTYINNSSKPSFNNTTITDALAHNIFSYNNNLHQVTTFNDLLADTGIAFNIANISFNNIHDLIIDESLNTLSIPSSYYYFLQLSNTAYHPISLKNKLQYSFYICYPPRVQQDPSFNLISHQITIPFNKDISFNKSNIFIMNNNNSYTYRDCKLINKTLYIDFSNFNKYAHGTFTILIKHTAISSISNYYSQHLEEDYHFNFFIPEYKCPQPCLPPTIKTNLKGFPGGTLISTNNDYGSHNTSAMKYSKQVNNPTSYKNPSVIVKTSHKRIIPRISNF